MGLLFMRRVIDGRRDGWDAWWGNNISFCYLVLQEQSELSLSKEQRKSSSLQVQVDKLQKKLDAASTALQKRFVLFQSANWTEIPAYWFPLYTVKCQMLQAQD